MILSNARRRRTKNDVAHIAYCLSVRRRLTFRDQEMPFSLKRLPGMPLRNAMYCATMKDCKLQDQIHTNAEVGTHDNCKLQSQLRIRLDIFK